MVKQLQFKMVLLLGILLAGVSSVFATDKWVLTNPTDLVSGDIVVIVDQTASCAMSNNGGTSSAPTATAVTLNNTKNEISGTVGSTLQWEVTVTTDEKEGRSYQFGISGTSNYLYCNDTNNGVRVGNNDNNSFTWKADPDNNNSTKPFLINSTTSRYIGVYNTNNGPQDWRCYTSINTNIKNTVTAFYKKVSNGKTDIASIGNTLTPKEVYVGDIDEFDLDITFAENTTEGTDYIVVWESSDPDILELDDETYEAIAAGEVTVTVTVTPEDDETYNEVSREFTVTVIDPNGPGTVNKPYTVAQARAAIDAGTGITGVYATGIVCTAGSLSSGTISYYISDDGSANSDRLQAYKGKGINGADFTSADDIQVGDIVIIKGNLKKYNSIYEFDSGNQLVSITHRMVPELSFGETTSFTCDLMLDFTAPELSTAEGFDGDITYTSSDESVATVDAETGEVTLVAVGTTTITASTTGSENFKAGETSYTLEVTVKAGVSPVGPAGAEGKFVKVTNTDDITDGEYLIVYEGDDSHGSVAFNGSLTTLDAVSNTIAVTFEEDGSIKETETNKTATFTIDVTNGTLKSASGLYIGVPNNSNGLKQTNEASTYTNSFAIKEDGTAEIKAVFNDSKMTLRYNYASNQSRFRYYSSGQQPIQLYKYKYIPAEPVENFDVTIGSTGYKTLVSTVPFSAPEGVTAYIVTECSTTEATLAPITEVPAGEPVILKGDEGTVTLSVLETAEDVTDNLLKVADETTGNGVYVLAKKNGNAGFYKWTGGSLGAGRVYLDAPQGNGEARQFLAFSFGGETTGIAEVENMKKAEGENIFDLQGRRVSKPTKGLYIVNGKKIIK